MAVNIKASGLRDTAPCSLENICQHFAKKLLPMPTG
jgi:hypothetical protein